eukprot:CFRG8496T1
MEGKQTVTAGSDVDIDATTDTAGTSSLSGSKVASLQAPAKAVCMDVSHQSDNVDIAEIVPICKCSRASDNVSTRRLSLHLTHFTSLDAKTESVGEGVSACMGAVEGTDMRIHGREVAGRLPLETETANTSMDVVSSENPGDDQESVNSTAHEIPRVTSPVDFAHLTNALSNSIDSCTAVDVSLQPNIDSSQVHSSTEQFECPRFKAASMGAVPCVEPGAVGSSAEEGNIVDGESSSLNTRSEIGRSNSENASINRETGTVKDEASSVTCLTPKQSCTRTATSSSSSTSTPTFIYASSSTSARKTGLQASVSQSTMDVNLSETQPEDVPAKSLAALSLISALDIETQAMGRDICRVTEGLRVKMGAIAQDTLLHSRAYQVAVGQYGAKCDEALSSFIELISSCQELDEAMHCVYDLEELTKTVDQQLTQFESLLDM